MDTINERRSIRKYQDRPVEKQLITDIIDAGRVAPSAKNRQPWKYIVFTEKAKEEMLDRMKEGLNREDHIAAYLTESRSGIPDAYNTLRIMYEAPVIILVLNTNGRSPFITLSTDDRITEICDTLSIGASIQNILLKAHECGLGTLWIANTCFAYKELTEYLETESQLVGAIAVGYPDESPVRRPRKTLDEIVEFRS